MPDLPQISEAEFEVMKVVWKNAPVSTNDITDTLTSRTKWSPKTVHTLIKRLVDKGALSYIKQGRVYVYTPLVNEKEYLSHQSHRFLERFFEGKITSMFSAYLEEEKLSEQEIAKLRSLLK